MRRAITREERRVVILDGRSKPKQDRPGGSECEEIKPLADQADVDPHELATASDFARLLLEE